MSTLPRAARSNVPSMTVCDSCLVPVPELPMTYQRGNSDILCPVCAAREALEYAASEHLHALIYPTVLTWARYWKAAGVSDGAIAGALALEGMHWHPDGALVRRGDSFDSAAAVVREALGEG